MLSIHRAERADALVVGLSAVLARASGDPFAPEIVAVPSRGVERWLAQQLSHVLGAGERDDGVCANVVFPSHTTVLDDALVESDPAYAAAVEAWDPERVIWPLLEVIDRDVPADPSFAVLAVHLGTGEGDRGRRVAVAGKLARLFDRYGRSRPGLIRGWADGGDEVPEDLRWQAELWRRLRADLGVPAPAELLDDACARVTEGPAFSIFGATRISPARVRALGAVAATRDVHLWLHHPSPALWEAVRGEEPGPRRGRAPVARNPLLASLSRDVRELQQLLGPFVGADELLPPVGGPPPTTLLRRIQHELATDTVPGSRGPLDPSIQIHAAHGPARQVEVVRETILGLLADDPTLEPRDIVIMCPDVEAFAPLVAAAFGSGEGSSFGHGDGSSAAPGGHPAAALRVRLADRSLRQINPLLGLLDHLLELANDRVTATALLDLAGLPPVRLRFGFDDDDVERLRAWAASAGARWGLDAAHRAPYGLGRVGQNTWRNAVDRMLLGVAMEESDAWLGKTLPLDDIDSSDIDLVGRFAEFVERVTAAVDSMGGQHTAPGWAQLLGDAVTSLGEGAEPWQAISVRRVLASTVEHAPDAGAAFGLADVHALLAERLAGRPTRASFRTGTLTVCTLVPMRAVPHRVVCLIGLDDGAFPRRGVADGDDVLARDPRSGERDVRSEDRQLFLDAICAAREHLVIAYTGADPRTGAPVPPCVPLGELLDAVDATAAGPDGASAREHVVVRHPLQPFDRRNFEPGALGRARAPFSFDRAALAGATAGSGARAEPAPLVGAPLPASEPGDIALDDLVRFFQHPARGFLRQRLDVTTYDGDDDPADAMTVELDGLAGWAIGDRVLQRCLSGVPRRTAAAVERLRGELPPEQLGAAELQKITKRVDAVLAACQAELTTPAASRDVAVPLGDGRSLVGTVAGVRGRTILTVTYSTLAAKHRVAAWIRLLAVAAATDEPGWRAVTVGRSREDARRSVLSLSPDTARRCLEPLVRIRDAGLREPLPLALETSARYADRRQRGASVDDAVPAARTAWETDQFRPERDEPEHVLVHGERSAFADLLAPPAVDDDVYPDEPSRFGSLARLVWAPLLTVEDEF